jgi:uncharacterized 2Fe-2S/4Fe-4S cluster protein (DUF4445 family)
VAYAVIDNRKPAGICGSGIISGVAALLARGLIDRTGKFIESHQRLRKGKAGAEFVISTADETATGEDIVITQKDIENVQMAKAALYAGAKILMNKADVTALDRISLAGAFGSFIDPRAAQRIGMFPDIAPGAVSSVGNAAGEGSVMALLSKAEKQRAADMAAQVEYRELTLDPTFEHEFAMALMMPHMKDLFPKSSKEDE